MVRPELSRPPKEYVTANAAFWAPKPMADTAATKVKKAVQKEKK
jgi:hypothetical protein